MHQKFKIQHRTQLNPILPFISIKAAANQFHFFLQSTVHLFARHSDYLWIYFDCLSFENILLWQLPPQLRLNVNQMGELKGRLTHDGHIGHLTTTPPYVYVLKKWGGQLENTLYKW